MFRNFLIYSGLLITLSACSTGVSLQGEQYWQQISMSDAIYKQGPEAQTALDRDISRCVVDLRESGRTDVTRNAIPNDSVEQNPDQQKLADWDTPDHDGALLAEHSDYHDFDGCMKDKGWERVEYVPYEVADRARANWYRANVKYGYDPESDKSSAKKAPTNFGHLNH